MVLRIKSSVGMKRSATLSRVSEEDKRPNSPKSAKKPKPKQQKKKIEKFDAKKPKKPPTAFFYFLYVPISIHFFFVLMVCELFSALNECIKLCLC